MTSTKHADDLADLPINPKGVGNFKTVLNLTISVVGIGVLSLPRSIGKSGWAFSIGLLVTTCFLAHLSLQLLYRSIYKNPTAPLATYEDIGKAAWGPKGGILVALTTYLNLIAVCACLLLLFKTPLSFLTGLSESTCTFLAFAVVLPFSWIRSMKELSWLSAIGVGSVLLTLVAVVTFSSFRIMERQTENSNPSFSATPVEPLALGIGFATFMNSYTVAPVVPSVLASMRRPSDFPRVSATAFALVTFIFACIGFAGYFGCAEALQTDGSLAKAIMDWVEKNPSSIGHVLNYSVQIGLVVICFTHLLALFNPIGTGSEKVASMIESRWRMSVDQKTEVSMVTACISRTIALCACLGLALAVPDFDHLVSLLGSTLVMLLQLIYPFVFYYLLHRDVANKIVVIGAVLLGVAGMVFGTWGTVMNY